MYGQMADPKRNGVDGGGGHGRRQTARVGSDDASRQQLKHRLQSSVFQSGRYRPTGER